MTEQKQSPEPDIHQTLVQIHRELSKLRQKCHQLQDQNENIRNELAEMKAKGKSVFNGMSDKDRMAFKQHVNNLLTRIDRYLPD
jgi:uncharacterized membrane protein